MRDFNIDSPPILEDYATLVTSLANAVKASKSPWNKAQRLSVMLMFKNILDRLMQAYPSLFDEANDFSLCAFESNLVDPTSAANNTVSGGSDTSVKSAVALPRVWVVEGVSFTDYHAALWAQDLALAREKAFRIENERRDRVRRKAEVAVANPTMARKRKSNLRSDYDEWFYKTKDVVVTAHEVTQSMKRCGIMCGRMFNDAVKDRICDFADESVELEEKMSPSALLLYYNTVLQTFFHDFLRVVQHITRPRGSDAEILLYWNHTLPYLGKSEDVILRQECASAREEGITDQALETKFQLWMATKGGNAGRQPRAPRNPAPAAGTTPVSPYGTISIISNIYGTRIKGSKVPKEAAVRGGGMVNKCVNFGLLFLTDSYH